MENATPAGGLGAGGIKPVSGRAGGIPSMRGISWAQQAGREASDPFREVAVMEIRMANASIRQTGHFRSRLSARLQQSVDVLRHEGALRFLELSTLSLIEPVRSFRLRIAVSADARRALLKIKNGKRRRGLFIDCGSNIGQGYTFFSKYYTKQYFDYIMIEPNSNCIPYLQALRDSSGANIEIIGKAASVRDGFARLFGPPVDRDEPTYEGRSIVPEHNNSLYQTEDSAAELVETFSLSQLILDKSALYDVIILKMDVEGAEYELLLDMMSRRAHHRLYAAYIEFHSVYMKREDRDIKKAMEIDLKKRVKGDDILLREWI
jgi:FkbM family methyltransferase